MLCSVCITAGFFVVNFLRYAVSGVWADMTFVRRLNPLKNLCLCCRISRESANFHRWGPIRRFRILTACFDIGKGESNSCALTLAEFPFFPLFAFEK